MSKKSRPTWKDFQSVMDKDVVFGGTVSISNFEKLVARVSKLEKEMDTVVDTFDENNIIISDKGQKRLKSKKSKSKRSKKKSKKKSKKRSR
jgi:transposase